eukprot:520749-Hanusia_phi.AAC.1
MTGILTVNQEPLPPMFLALRRIAIFHRIKSCDFYYIEEILKALREGARPAGPGGWPGPGGPLRGSGSELAAGKRTVDRGSLLRNETLTGTVTVVLGFNLRVPNPARRALTRPLSVPHCGSAARSINLPGY